MDDGSPLSNSNGSKGVVRGCYFEPGEEGTSFLFLFFFFLRERESWLEAVDIRLFHEFYVKEEG